MALSLLDLLSLYGFPKGAKAKLVRHKDKKYDEAELLRRGWFEAYQSFQTRRVFDGVDFLVSFIGTGGRLARLVGVYRVKRRLPAKQGVVPADCPYADEWRQPRFTFYETEKLTGFDDLEHRVVIDWGDAALAWHQHLTDKPVIQILPPNQPLTVFRDYLEFTLTHDELRAIFRHEAAGSDWKSRLQAVAGVYLILAHDAQYVGAASGAEGIWGRWRSYAATGHGGNELLKELVERSPERYPREFVYSVLQVLPRTATRADVLESERRFKEKLGTRAVGLNKN